MSSKKRRQTSSSHSSSSSPSSSSTDNFSPPKTPKRPKMEIENHNPKSSNPADNKHTNYTKWAQDQGIKITSVQPLALPSRGIGLLATTRINASSTLIHVPQTSMIKAPAPVLRTHDLETASPQAQLAAYLTLSAMASPQPTWYRESRAVWPSPEDFKACMLAWSSDAELEVLRTWAPPGVRGPLERLLVDLARDGEEVGHLWEGDAWREEWVYHWILVNTRSFHWKPTGVKDGSMVMCPFLDYMNHCPNGHGCEVTVSTQGYELKADRDYNPGDEILATYGAHPNDKLLVHYGFILPDSPDDEIRLDHVILPRLNKSQQNILQDVAYLGGYALDPSTNELCFKTQVAVRSVLLTANEWEHYMGSGEDLASDKDSEVVEWLKPALEEYAQQADAAVEKLTKLRKEKTPSTAFESKLALLQARWEQIQAALKQFLL